MNQYVHRVVAEQQGALDNIAYKRKLAKVRAAREAKAAKKDKG